MSATVHGWVPVACYGDQIPLPASALRFMEASNIKREDSPPRGLSPPDLPFDEQYLTEGIAVRKGDPDWVGRPPNSFMIFRGAFSRKHAGTRPVGGRKGRRAAHEPAYKSLSRQAADAWHQLSPEEKSYWEQQAKNEKLLHAKRHPDYRYRPTRKPSTGRCPRTKNSSGAGPILRRAMVARHLKRSDSASTSSPSIKRSPSPQPTLLPIRPIRSFSASRAEESGQFFVDDPVRPDFRRSRSLGNACWPYDAASYQTTGNPTGFVPPPYVVAPPFASSSGQAALKVSPFTAIASSLSGWNSPATSSSDSLWTSAIPDQNLPQAALQSEPYNFNYLESACSNRAQPSSLCAIQEYEPFDQYGFPYVNFTLDQLQLPSDEELFEAYMAQ